MKSIDRRQFLKNSAGAAAALSVAGSFASAADKNSVLRVGVIGFRGRGNSHIQGFERLPNCEVVALCDVDGKLLKAGADQHDDRTGRKVKRFTDLRKLIDDKDIAGALIRISLRSLAVLALIYIAGRDAISAVAYAGATVAFLHLSYFWIVRYLVARGKFITKSVD